jgi:hypothetical protein
MRGDLESSENYAPPKKGKTKESTPTDKDRIPALI